MRRGARTCVASCAQVQLLHRAVYSEDGKTVRITAAQDRPLNNHLVAGDGSAADSAGEFSRGARVRA